MKPQLNDLIGWATDRRAPAEHADVADIGPPIEYGHLTQVETGNGITLDFADTNAVRRSPDLFEPTPLNW